MFFCSGSVVHGFGRGSKELGFPTEEAVVQKFPETLRNGIYSGFAQVENGHVYPMVASLGFNPHYKNEKRSFEVHILNKFDQDFYDSLLKVVLATYLREETDFKDTGESKNNNFFWIFSESLIAQINEDIRIAKIHLEEEKNLHLQKHTIFSSKITLDLDSR